MRNAGQNAPAGGWGGAGGTRGWMEQGSLLLLLPGAGGFLKIPLPPPRIPAAHFKCLFSQLNPFPQCESVWVFPLVFRFVSFLALNVVKLFSKCSFKNDPEALSFRKHQNASSTFPSCPPLPSPNSNSAQICEFVLVAVKLGNSTGNYLFPCKSLRVPGSPTSAQAALPFFPSFHPNLLLWQGAFVDPRVYMLQSCIGHWGLELGIF